ncbi:MAG: hypothetical protein IIB77_13620, partial [Proteobacteria bacterium]|nr:hypothetical protein [Pseudomonadota bacterium]
AMSEEERKSLRAAIDKEAESYLDACAEYKGCGKDAFVIGVMRGANYMKARMEQEKKLMDPIPPGAMPVVEILRRNVDKPTTLPRLWNKWGSVILWARQRNRNVWMSDPMGLHKLSSTPTPYSGKDFAGGLCSTAEVRAFADWWDDVLAQDAQQAINDIWPKGKS